MKRSNILCAMAIVAAVSAPTNLAVEFARESRQTLVGFLREHTMNVYTEPERIRWPKLQKTVVKSR